jgi:hypothetical protein
VDVYEMTGVRYKRDERLRRMLRPDVYRQICTPYSGQMKPITKVIKVPRPVEAPQIVAPVPVRVPEREPVRVPA